METQLVELNQKKKILYFLIKLILYYYFIKSLGCWISFQSSCKGKIIIFFSFLDKN